MQAERQQIQIRFAAPADRDDVARLAELDSAGRVDGDALVAVVDGEVRAALTLEPRRVIADPFKPSAELTSLLVLRASQIGDDGSRQEHRPLRALAHAVPFVGRFA